MQKTHSADEQNKEYLFLEISKMYSEEFNGKMQDGH